jgi:hypothetical protein
VSRPLTGGEGFAVAHALSNNKAAKATEIRTLRHGIIIMGIGLAILH